MQRNPHHIVDRVEHLLDQKSAPTAQDGERVAKLWRVITGEEKDPSIAYALDKYEDEMSQIILDSYFLAQADLDVIRKATDIPAAVLKAYGEYFFDNSVFRDRLDRVSYVSRCKEYLPPEQSAYYTAALSKGPDYITWLLHGAVSRTPKQVIENVMIEGYFMGKNHRGLDPASEVAKQARAWLTAGHQAAVNLVKTGVTDQQEAFDELRVALLPEDNVINKDTTGAPSPDEILH